MILVDSSVWIDYFNGADTPEAATLDRLLGAEPLLVGDLILTEVLQGFRSDEAFETARRLLASFEVVPLLGADAAIRAAQRFRALRRRGITTRKTADVIIASFCIDQDLQLLASDRDFLPFAEHLGLSLVRVEG